MFAAERKRKSEESEEQREKRPRMDNSGNMPAEVKDECDLKRPNDPEKGKERFDEDIFNDCWVHIFQRLPLKKRIQLERVSPKWKRLMPYSDITLVQLDDFRWPRDSLMERQYITAQYIMQHWDSPEITVVVVREEDLRRVLMGVLSRCGPSLRHLDLCHDMMQGLRRFGLNKVLAELLVEKAPSLQSLLFWNSVLSLSCFPVLTHLDKLEELHLSGVYITSEEDFSSAVQDKKVMETAISSTIQNLPALKGLCFLMADLDICPTIRNASLKELYMDGPTLTAASVKDLVHHCPNLESLYLDFSDQGTEFTPSDLQLGALAGLHKLQNLSLVDGILHSADLTAICRGCPKLEMLDLDGMEELSSCAELWRLPQLKKLHIYDFDGNIPVDEALASVAKYGLLENVKLSCTKVTNHGLSTLAACPNLVKLELDENEATTDEGLKAILENCKRLEELDICLMSIGDDSMSVLGAKGVSLKTVALEKTQTKQDGIKRLIVERQKRLTEGEELVPLEVSLDFCSETDQGDLYAVSLTLTPKDSSLD